MITIHYNNVLPKALKRNNINHRKSLSYAVKIILYVGYLEIHGTV